MRTVITVIIISGVGCLAYFLFDYFYNVTDELKIIVPERHYSYIYEEDTIMDVLLYSNSLTLVETIDEEAYLTNIDESNKFPIDLLEINYLYTQVYDEEDLYLIQLLFFLPNIETSYEIDELFMYLKNDGKETSIYLGSINIYYNDDFHQEFFLWNYIEGNKNEGAHLSKIIIGYEGEIIPNEIFIDNKLVDFSVFNNELMIEIKPKDVIFDSTFIIFSYNNQKQFINNFKFFYHYDLLNNIKNREYIIKN